jgi:hypothetical protein
VSRSGYRDDCCYGTAEYNLWRGTVQRALNGKRGQAFLRDCLAALDALPDKKLASSVLVEDGACCAMGAVAIARGIDTSGVDPCEREDVAKLFGISGAMAAEIAYINDQDFQWSTETPEQRFIRVRKWVVENLRTKQGAK